MTKKSNKIKVTESPSELSGIKEYLKNLKGEKVFTFEETSSSQWLYSELKPFVKKLNEIDNQIETNEDTRRSLKSYQRGIKRFVCSRVFRE